MRANKLKAAWAAGERTANGWLSIPSSFSAEIMAHAGFPSVTLDLQHGLIDYQVAVAMLQAISTTDVVPLARVPWREAGICMKLLDAGAYGIICPMVNTRAQAEEFVSWCYYAPKGQRSFGPIRASIYGGADYGTAANDEILSLAMIETVEAMSNLDAIVSTPGLSGVYVGPADLALSMGEAARLDPVAPRVLDAIATVLQAVKKAGRFAGIHCGSTEFAKRMHKDGFDFCSLLSDARFLGIQAAAMIKDMGDKPGDAAASGSPY